MHPDISEIPVFVDILGDGQRLKMVSLTDNMWQKLTLPARDLEGKKVLSFRVSRTWSPRAAGISSDSRNLGIAVIMPE
jgi:hypothetical protein